MVSHKYESDCLDRPRGARPDGQRDPAAEAFLQEIHHPTVPSNEQADQLANAAAELNAEGKPVDRDVAIVRILITSSGFRQRRLLMVMTKHACRTYESWIMSCKMKYTPDSSGARVTRTPCTSGAGNKFSL